MTQKYWAGPVFAALAALLATPALAQDASGAGEANATGATIEADANANNPARTEEADDQAGGGLDEIIVTAQHRTQDFREVPISMTVVGIEEMKDRNIGDINELGEIVPNIQVKTGATVSFIFFRGLGSGLNRGFETSVGVFMDGMYLGRPAYFSNGFIDLGMAEILRGPQGTLFGKNTVAGAFLLRTVRPEEDFGGYVDVMFGERNHQRYRAALNVPIFDTGLYSRGAFAQDKRDGYVYNRKLDRMEGDTGNTDYQIRLRYKPDNLMDLNLKVRLSDVDQKANGSSQIIFLSEFARLSFEPFDPDIEDNKDDFETSLDHPGFVTRETWDVIGEAEFNFWDHHLTVIGTHSEYDEYSETDVDFGPAPALIAYFPEQYNQQSIEFRIASEDDQTLEYIAGAYAFQSEIRAFTRVDAFPLNIPGIVVDEALPPAAAALLTGILPDGQTFVSEQQLDWFDQDTFSWAIFGQMTWNVTDRLHLLGGLRYSYDHKKLDYRQEFTNTKVFFDQVAEFDEFDLRGLERDETDLSPKASVIFDINDEMSAYATIAQGFKAGGYNESSATADEVEFDAEKSTTYEAGIKGRILGGFAQFAFGGFWTEFDDLQVSSYNGARFIVSNAARAVTRGFEWEAGAILGEGLFVGFNGGYTDAFYRSHKNGECQVNDERDTCDLSGNVLTNAPEWNGSAMVHYERPLTSGITAFVGGDAIFVTKVFYQPDLDPIDTQDGYVQFNGRLGLKDPDGIWTFSVYGKNLTDEIINFGSGDVPVFEGAHFGAIQPPLTIDAEFRLVF